MRPSRNPQISISEATALVAANALVFLLLFPRGNISERRFASLSFAEAPYEKYERPACGQEVKRPLLRREALPFTKDCLVCVHSVFNYVPFLFVWITPPCTLLSLSNKVSRQNSFSLKSIIYLKCIQTQKFLIFYLILYIT